MAPSLRPSSAEILQSFFNRVPVHEDMDVEFVFESTTQNAKYLERDQGKALRGQGFRTYPFVMRYQSPT